MLPGSTLLAESVFSISSTLIPVMASLSLSGTICKSLPGTPVISAIALRVTVRCGVSPHSPPIRTTPEIVARRVFLISTVVFQSHIDIKYRNIRCTRFDSLGTRHFLGKTVHSGIYLLIHLYKCQIGIHTKIKFQTDTPAPSRVSLFISLSPATCSNCLRTGVTTVFSSRVPMNSRPLPVW